MTDIGSITAILSSVKTATDIAKIIKNADLSLEKAEMKLKIADLITALADAKIAVTEVQDIIKEKDERITEWEKAFEMKEKLVRILDAYYEVDAAGEPSGPPYCSHCWEVSRMTIHLYSVPHKVICSHCKTEYANYRAPLEPKKELKKRS